METAKVDIRKLQLLNDRISQCFEALNQVRLSVHGVQGLSHSNPPMDPRTAGVPAGYAGIPNQVFGIGYPQASPYPQQVSPFAAQSPYVPGISHTSGLPLPGVVPNVPNPIGAWDPRLDPRLAAAATGQLQAGQAGYPQVGYQGVPGVGIGLSHTGAEAVDPLGRTWNDPILTARVVQTFPYATFAFLPISSI